MGKFEDTNENLTFGFEGKLKRIAFNEEIPKNW
ncbi:MAG: hypothetical protein CM15mP102_04380 [Flavobacteriales bacterium]|nr:MAG: hypothetical protein CM15mP102_04380 [Flavobacteriales bacterium]